MVVPWSTRWLMAVMAILSAAPTLVTAGVDDTAEVRYRLGSDFAGVASGTCDAWALDLPGPGHKALRFHASGAEWRIHETETDSIQSRSLRIGIGSYAASKHNESTVVLPPGMGEVRAGEGGRILVVPTPDVVKGIGDHAARAEFRAQRVAVEPIKTQQVLQTLLLRPANPGDHGVTFIALGTPFRWMSFAGGELALAGDVALYLEDAEVVVGGSRFVVGPARQTREAPGASDAAAVTTVVERYALLHLKGARLKLDAQGARVACDQVEAELEGTLNVYGASGSIAAGHRRQEFQERELTLAGSMNWAERTSPSEVFASGSGRFAAANLDFVPLPGWDSRAALASIGAAAAVLAALAYATSQSSRLIGFFFTRFTPDRILLHPMRQEMYRTIRADPGIILRDLVKKTGRPYGVIRHHTRLLEMLGTVKTLRRGKALHLYPADESLALARRELALREDAPVRFLVEKALGGPLSPSDPYRLLAEEFGLSKMGAWKVVKRAEKSGLLARIKDDLGVRIVAAA